MLKSDIVTRAQKWATRARILLGAAAALVILDFTDRGPMWPGVLVAIGGELIQLWAAAHLRKNARIVTSGPYAWLRNPMYLGRFFVGLGFMLLTHRWFVILPYVAGFWVYAQARVMGEEARLRELFGQEYDEYCQQVNRWLPRRPQTRTSGERWSWAAVFQNHQLRVTAGVLLAMCLLKIRVAVLGSFLSHG